MIGHLCAVYIIKIWIPSSPMPGLQLKVTLSASLSCTRVVVSFYMSSWDQQALRRPGGSSEGNDFHAVSNSFTLEDLIHSFGNCTELSPQDFSILLRLDVYLIGAIQMLMKFKFWLVDLEWDPRCIFPQSCWVFSKLVTTKHSFESNAVCVFFLMC